MSNTIKKLSLTAVALVLAIASVHVSAQTKPAPPTATGPVFHYVPRDRGLDHSYRLRHAGGGPALFDRSGHAGALLPTPWLLGTSCGGRSVCRHLVRRPGPDSFRVALPGRARRLPLAARQFATWPAGARQSSQARSRDGSAGSLRPRDPIPGRRPPAPRVH